MRRDIQIKTCMECNRGVYGFWKYGQNPVCSKNCLRRAIATSKIPRLDPTKADRELGIAAPSNK